MGRENRGRLFNGYGLLFGSDGEKKGFGSRQRLNNTVDVLNVTKPFTEMVNFVMWILPRFLKMCLIFF